MLMVNYCGQSMSVVRHATSTIDLKAYSYTPGQIDSILGRKHRGDFTSKIAKIMPIGNPRWPPS